MKRKGKIGISIIFLILLSFIYSTLSLTTACKESHAEWRDSNGQPYLYIYAKDYQELGVFEGQYLADEIISYKTAIGLLASQLGVSYDILIQMAATYEPFISEEYQIEMQGIADGVNLEMGACVISYEDILVQNCASDILYGQLLPIAFGANTVYPSMGCTALGVLNRFHRRSYPMIAQNMDLPFILEPPKSWVLTKMPHKPYIFSFRLGASLALFMGKSSYGISVTTNIVRTRIYCPPNGAPWSVAARMAFENARTAAEYVDYLPQTVCMNYMVCDFHKLYALEVTSLGKIIEDVSDTAVRTNTFVTEELKQYLIDPTYSVARQEYAEERLEAVFHQTRQFQYVKPSDLLAILSDNDIINRKPPEEGITIAFFLSIGLFGLGNAADNPIGICPI